MTRALILGCAGPALSAAETAFFAEADPLGFILFARNVETPEQVTALCAALRSAVGRTDAPILIDQEGGRVARLRAPHWRAIPPMAEIGALAARDREAGLNAAWTAGRLLAADCVPLGVDTICAPVLDLRFDGAHDIIGDRAFSDAPAIVAACGRALLDGMAAGGATGVIKHIPGHGRALADSHLALPRVETDLGTLSMSDFKPFQALADAPMAMTAHILYPAIDPRRPITTSPDGIEGVIRRRIGFRGLLMSDDLCMQALEGDMGARAADAVGAGCDVALHCNGDLEEGNAASAGAGPLTPAGLARLDAARARTAGLTQRDAFDADAAYNGLLEAVAGEAAA